VRLVALVLVALIRGAIAVVRAVPVRAWPYLAALGAMCGFIYLLVSNLPALGRGHLVFVAFVSVVGLGMWALLRTMRRHGPVSPGPRPEGPGASRQGPLNAPANAIGLAGLTVPSAAKTASPSSGLAQAAPSIHRAGVVQQFPPPHSDRPSSDDETSSSAKLLRDLELLRSRPSQEHGVPFRAASPTAPTKVVAPRLSPSVVVGQPVPTMVSRAVEPLIAQDAPVTPKPSSDRPKLEAALQELRGSRLDSRTRTSTPELAKGPLQPEVPVSIRVPSGVPTGPRTVVVPSVPPATGRAQSTSTLGTRDALSRLAAALNSRERLHGNVEAVQPPGRASELSVAPVEPVAIPVLSGSASPTFRLPEPTITRPRLQDINVDLAARFAELEARELPSPVRPPQAENKPPVALDMLKVALIRQEPPTIVSREGADPGSAHQDPEPPMAVQQPTTRPIDVKPKVALEPPKLRPTVDLSRIARLQEESRAVDALLSKIFTDELRHESASPAEIELPQLHGDAASAVLLSGLDEPHTRFAAIVVSRLKWTREELSELAVANGLMLDGALELINDCAFEAFGEPLTEERASIEVNGDISAQMKAQTFADSQREKTEA